jgi:hypothetical protein
VGISVQNKEGQRDEEAELHEDDTSRGEDEAQVAEDGGVGPDGARGLVRGWDAGTPDSTTSKPSDAAQG